MIERTQRLLDERIIREITPIFDTRALGYSSMLVAAKVDSEHPHRRGADHQRAPGRLAQLPAHPRVQPLVHDRDRARLRARPRGHARRPAASSPGAESIRQLPTLKLFKINMNLEMEKGTDALAAAAEADDAHVTRRGRALRRLRHRRDPGAAGTDGGSHRRPTHPAAASWGSTVDALLDQLEEMIERKLLRRVAAILYHRRAGFSANGMGVWKVPEEQIAELGPRMAAVRGISHCYERPTYPDWPYSVFTMAHGRSKEECDAVLDGVADDCGSRRRPTARRSTRRPSSRRSACTTSRPTTRSGKPSTDEPRRRPAPPATPARTSSIDRALGVLPGGVNSPVRAMRSIGREPLFVASGRGRRDRSTSTATATSTTSARGAR